MMLILSQTIQIGFISLIVFLALYILMIFIMNLIQMMKDRGGFFKFKSSITLQTQRKN